MKKEKIETEYKSMVECIYDAYGILEVLVHEINNDLYKFDKMKNYEKNHAYEIEAAQIYLELFFAKLEELLLYIEENSFDI